MDCGKSVDVLGIGYGPSGLALAVAYEEIVPRKSAFSLMFTEKDDTVKWHKGLMLPWVISQVSFLKDLVTLRNPRSKFTFINYLHSIGKLDDFINLGTFNPLRSEISDYLTWVAENVERSVYVYNHNCREISPVKINGKIVGWNATYDNGHIIQATDLVLSIGRNLNIPEVFSALPRDRVIHSEHYLQSIQRFKGRRGLRVAIIGSAQSAAEMFKSVHDDLLECRPTLIMRKAGFRYYDGNPFLNELYMPSFVDQFFAMARDTREDILKQMHLTNYGGLAAGFLNELYRMLYLQKANGLPQSRILTMREIEQAQSSGDELRLTMKNKASQTVEEESFDLVLLGTGFSNTLPSILSGVDDLILKDDRQEPILSRDYQLSLPENVGAAIFLQGLAESSHGIADTLLSNLADRSQRIVRQLMRRHCAAEFPDHLYHKIPPVAAQ